MSQARKVEQIKENQIPWFDRLFIEHVRSVYRWVCFFGIDDAGAEEVTQEVFITALKKQDTLETEAQIPVWLFQIARRHAANYRRNSWVRRIFRRGQCEVTPSGIPQCDDREQERELETRRILSRMPIKLVEVLIMHDMDGYTREEIAAILNVPSGTVASRIRKARTVFTRAWNGAVTS